MEDEPSAVEVLEPLIKLEPVEPEDCNNLETAESANFFIQQVLEDPLRFEYEDCNQFAPPYIKEEPCDVVNLGNKETDGFSTEDPLVNNQLNSKITRNQSKQLLVRRKSIKSEENDSFSDAKVIFSDEVPNETDGDKPIKRRRRRRRRSELSEEELSDGKKSYKTPLHTRLKRAQERRDFRANESLEETEQRRLKCRIARMKARLLEKITSSEDQLSMQRQRIAMEKRLARQKQRESETPEQRAERKRKQSEQARISRNRLKAAETPEETVMRRLLKRQMHDLKTNKVRVGRGRKKKVKVDAMQGIAPIEIQNGLIVDRSDTAARSSDQPVAKLQAQMCLPHAAETDASSVISEIPTEICTATSLPSTLTDMPCNIEGRSSNVGDLHLHSGSECMTSSTLDTPINRMNMPTSITDLSSATIRLHNSIANMPSSIANMPSSIANMSSRITNMPGSISNMPSSIAHMATSIANMPPSSIADMPTRNAGMHSSITDLPSSITGTPNGTADMPSTIPGMLSTITGMPSNIPDMSNTAAVISSTISGTPTNAAGLLGSSSVIHAVSQNISGNIPAVRSIMPTVTNIAPIMPSVTPQLAESVYSVQSSVTSVLNAAAMIPKADSIRLQNAINLHNYGNVDIPVGCSVSNSPSAQCYRTPNTIVELSPMHRREMISPQYLSPPPPSTTGS